MKHFLIFCLAILGPAAFCQNKKDVNFKIENDSTITQFLKERHVPFSNSQVATLKNIKIFGEYAKSQKLGVPDAYFFNSKGELIENSGKGTACGVQLKKLDKILKMKTIPGENLASVMDGITVLDGSPFFSGEADLYVIITWGKVLSSESETSLSWFTNLGSAKGLKIKALLLNIDVQQRWNLTDGQKKYLGIE